MVLHGRPQSGLIWGAALALVGMVLFLDHLGFIEIQHLYRFWPLILVAAGLANLTSWTGRPWGVMLIIAGGILQLNALGITHLRFSDLWPVAIIAIGLLVMWGSLETQRATRRHHEDAAASWGGGSGATSATGAAEGGPNPNPGPSAGFAGSTGSGEGDLNAAAVLGGVEQRVTTKNFRGGKITTIFGGAEIDFRDADIQGEDAVLELNCIFGGVDLRVPRNWDVYSRTLPVFGGYSDKSASDAGSAAPKKTLVITGTIIFGGVEIRN